MFAVATAACLLASGPAAAQTGAAIPRELLEQIRFTITEVRIEGNTLVSAGELQAGVQPFLGNGRNVEDLSGIRRAITEVYRRKGYELLRVGYEASRSRGGIHYFVVHEVKLGKVRVTGNSAVSEAEARRQLPSLAEGATPRLGELARELFLFNDNPSRNATLEYTGAGAGVTEVEVKLAEQPQSRTAATLNNSGTEATGRRRIGLYWNHNNFLEHSHQVAASVTTSPERPERVFVAGFSYLVPLPALGDQLAFSASYSDVDSGRVADLFNVYGKGATWSAHYLRNLARSASSRHTLDAGYDERRYRDVIDYFGANLGVDVTAKPLSVGYRYSGLISGHGVSFGATVQQNLPGGTRNDDATYGASRAGAHARWQSWQFDAGWQRESASGWMPALRLAGQYAREPLIAAEQFGLGGLHAVRGFDEREGAGDRGWRANLELYGPRLTEGQRLLGFVDLGHSARLNAQPGERSAEGVSSYGLGWRGQYRNGLQVGADVARVADGTPRNPHGDVMLHVSAIWWF